MKIGLLPLYLALYDNHRQEAAARARTFIEVIANELAARGFDVVSSPACRLKQEFADAVELFEESSCQAIATLHLAYSPSLESVEALARSSLPVVVIDTTPDFAFTPELTMANHGIHGVQDLCNLLLRHRKPFLISAGHHGQSHFLDRVEKQLRSAQMAYRMTHIRVGKAGGDFAGMGDFRVPDGTFGMKVIEYTPQDEPAEEEIDAEMRLDRQKFRWDGSVTEESYRRTVGASLKIRHWLEKEELHAFTITFSGIDREGGWQTVPFLECSKAMARGIGYAGEGDVLTAAATRSLMEIFPESSFTEMFCPDWKNDRIYTSHMGEINPAVCAAKPLLHERKYIFSDTGNPVLATGCFKAGEALLADLAPGPDGSFTLIAAKVEYEVPELNNPKSNAGWFRPLAGNIGSFLEEYSSHGGTHHLTCCYGGAVEHLREWAHLMNWRFVEIK